MHSAPEAQVHQSDEAEHFAPSEPQLRDPVSDDKYTYIIMRNCKKNQQNNHNQLVNKQKSWYSFQSIRNGNRTQK